jgi:serine/threonine-protein phosphatase 6 regulatory ankyrin repeat subunit B
VSLLLDAGADVRAVDEEGMSALANAAQKNHGDVAYELVARGADPDDAGFVDDDAVAHNLLWDAVAAGNEAFAALLVAKGAACGAADARGSTALVNAAHKGLNATVDALLAGGADPAARNDEGVDALIAAASEGHGAVVDSLVAALAAAGAGLDGADKDGTTALMAAAVRGHGAVLDALLAGRAAVDARNGDGHTALMFAYNGKNQVKTLEAKYLKAVGGAPGGGSAVAADSNLEVIAAALAGHEAIVAKLLAAGADPALADNEGHVAADFDYKAPDDEPAAGAGGEL